MFGLKHLRNIFDDDAAEHEQDVPGGSSRRPTGGQIRRAGTLENQQRLLAPGGLGRQRAVQAPRAMPHPVPEPAIPTVSITVVDDSDNIGKIDALQRRGEIKDWTSVAHMVDQILAKGAGKKIGTLRIYDHGAPGVQELGEDWVASPADAGPPGAAMRELERLTGHFAADGRVVLHGCKVAEGPSGPALLAMLARTWGVPVQASEIVQYSVPRELQGPTVECSPEAGDQWFNLLQQGGDVDAVEPECTRDAGTDRSGLDNVKGVALGGLYGVWNDVKKAKFW